MRRFAHWEPNRATVVLHTDTALYHRFKVRRDTEGDLFEKRSKGKDFGYNLHMNHLYRIRSHTHYSFAYNLEEMINPERILHRITHITPKYTMEALETRPEIIATNGERRTYHAGAYLGNGLHEGAVASAVQVSRLLGGATL
jgi:predicted NAD/FAD-binding protein